MKYDPADEARRSPDRYLSGYPDMLLDDKTALVTEVDFHRITTRAGGYHSSMPSGVIPGKVWYREEHYVRDRKDPTMCRMVFGGGDPDLTRRLLGSYEPHPTTPDTHVVTRFRELIIA